MTRKNVTANDGLMGSQRVRQHVTLITDRRFPGSWVVCPSQCRTCKGDAASQWKMAILGCQNSVTPEPID